MLFRPTTTTTAQPRLKEHFAAAQNFETLLQDTVPPRRNPLGSFLPLAAGPSLGSLPAVHNTFNIHNHQFHAHLSFATPPAAGLGANIIRFPPIAPNPLAHAHNHAYTFAHPSRALLEGLPPLQVHPTPRSMGGPPSIYPTSTQNFPFDATSAAFHLPPMRGAAADRTQTPAPRPQPNPQAFGEPSRAGDREPDSDDFLHELLTRDFSSPSILSQSPRQFTAPSNNFEVAPNSTRLPSPAVPPRDSPFDWAQQSGHLGTGASYVGALEEDEDGNATGSSLFGSPLPSHDMPSRPRRVPADSGSAQGTSGASSRSTVGRRSTGIGLREGSRDSPIPVPESSPPQRRAKRKRSSDETPTSAKREALDSDDLFGDGDQVEPIDLTETNKVPDSVLLLKPKNEVKLSSFQCVICMEDVTDLTVTHCGKTSPPKVLYFLPATNSLLGHLFCSECLHSSLHIDPHKKNCPICRQSIVMPESGKSKHKQKGFYALELKLKTKKSLGKRAVQG